MPLIKIKLEFGQEVADLVEGVTKISVFENKAITGRNKEKFSKAENFRKLIIATSKDIRVLLVKLADRLHNMRTIKYLKDDEKKIESSRNYGDLRSSPDRMGMNRIRDELEDLSFEVLNSEARKLIKNRLDEIKYNNLINFKTLSEDSLKF